MTNSHSVSKPLVVLLALALGLQRSFGLLLTPMSGDLAGCGGSDADRPVRHCRLGRMRLARHRSVALCLVVAALHLPINEKPLVAMQHARVTDS